MEWRSGWWLVVWCDVAKGATADDIKNKETVKEKGIEGWKPDTRHSIAAKGEEASNLKNERATKAKNPDTVKSVATKGNAADNLKNERTTKALGPDTVESIEAKGETASNLKNEKKTKAEVDIAR